MIAISTRLRDTLVSKKNLSQTLVLWVSAQGQVNSAKNAKTCPYMDVTPRKPQTQNEKNIFLCELENVLNP